MLDNLDSWLVESRMHLLSTNGPDVSSNKYNISQHMLNQINATIIKVFQEISESIHECDRLENSLKIVKENATKQQVDWSTLRTAYEKIASTHMLLSNTVVKTESLLKQLSTDRQLLLPSLNSIQVSQSIL